MSYGAVNKTCVGRADTFTSNSRSRDVLRYSIGIIYVYMSTVRKKGM